MKTVKNLFILGIMLLMLSGFISNATLRDKFQLGSGNLKPALSGPPIQFGEIITGKNSRYHERPAGTFFQDLSGAATDGNHIIFADDGGDPPDFNFVRVMSEFPDNNAVNIPLALTHKDLEGATFHRDYFVVTGSLAEAGNPDTRRLTRFKLDSSSNQLVEETSVDLRDRLMAGLQARFGNEWFDRIKNADPRAGGLNIEGISGPHTGQNLLLWGLRSPLFGNNFPTNLRDGVAIIAAVYNPFSGDPSIDFITVDLQGDGIRGMEWIPKLHGYVIIGGPVERGNTYTLWRLRLNGELEKIDLPGFHSLCRPESVMQLNQNGKHYLVVLSEESGAACNNTPYTFIQAEILSDDDD